MTTLEISLTLLLLSANPGNTATHADLKTAVFYGEAERVAKLATRESVRAARFSRGRTLLHLATERDAPKVVEILLDRGAKLEARDSWGRTPLHAAAATMSISSLRVLLAHGADLTAQSRTGATPLLLALARSNRDGHVPEVIDLLAARSRKLGIRLKLHDAHTPALLRFLLQSGADPDTRDERGLTLLHHVASGHGNEKTKILLDAGADVNAIVDRHHCPECVGDTPLERAVTSVGERWSRLNGLRLLLDRGADPQGVQGVRGDGTPDPSPLAYALAIGNQEAIDLLRLARAKEPGDVEDRGYQPTAIVFPPLHQAIMQGDLATVRTLLDQGEDPHQKAIVPPCECICPYSGLVATPLSLAVGHPEIVSLLLRRGADPDGADPRSKAAGLELYGGEVDWGLDYLGGPLRSAAAWGDEEVVEQLLAAGADVQLADLFGMTALHLAALYGREHMISRLLMAGADVNSREYHGQTPLHFAVTFFDTIFVSTDPGSLRARLVEQLLDAGADVDGGVPPSQDPWRSPTPLQQATRRYPKAAAAIGRFLLSEGARFPAFGSWTRLHALAALGDYEALEELVGEGHDLNAKSQDGQRLLQIFTDQGRLSAVRLLLKHGVDPEPEGLYKH